MALVVLTGRGTGVEGRDSRAVSDGHVEVLLVDRREVRVASEEIAIDVDAIHDGRPLSSYRALDERCVEDFGHVGEDLGCK